VSVVLPLVGGITAGMYRIQLSRGRRRPHAVVLRQWDGRITVDAAALVRREAHALQTLVGTGIPAPHLEAADPIGLEAGVPSLLMSLAPGEVDLTPTDFDAWLRELAATLVAIHATGIEAEPYESWIPSALPAWAERDDLWGRAFATAWALPSTVQRVFLHRDFQHFNVLWRDGLVSGVVDWPKRRNRPTRDRRRPLPTEPGGSVLGRGRRAVPRDLPGAGWATGGSPGGRRRPLLLRAGLAAVPAPAGRGPGSSRRDGHASPRRGRAAASPSKALKPDLAHEWIFVKIKSC
jgi:hypothetical protein